MTTSTWHAPDDLLARFAREPGSLDDAVASSLEAHLVACRACRAGVAAATDRATLTSSWDRLVAVVDQPHAGRVEGLLTRVGLDDGLARLLTATPALQAAGLAAVVVVAAAAVATSRLADADGPFLVLAPLAPLAAVAATFAPAADPAGEAGVATAVHGLGLVVRRAAVVLLSSFGLLGLASLALPSVGPLAAAWVLPALAICVGALALATWVRIEVVVAALALAWLAVVWTLWWADGRPATIVDTGPFTAAGQTVALCLALAAAAAVVARRDRFATLEAF